LFKDKNDVALKEGDSVRVLRNADGYRNGLIVVANREAPFEATVVGFAAEEDVVVELDGSRYSVNGSDVEAIKAHKEPEPATG